MSKLTSLIGSLFMVLVCLWTSSCKNNASKQKDSLYGHYRLTFDLKEEKLPVIMELQQDKDSSLKALFINGDEQIISDEITTHKDSIFIKMPIYDSELKLKQQEDLLEGYWYDYERGNYKIAVSGKIGEEHKYPQMDMNANEDEWTTGQWSVNFINNEEEITPSIARFEQTGNIIEGTFLTETGDYRYLSGIVSGKDIRLSCFDGAHAFLFTATLGEDSILKGKFYSGHHWQELWTAVKDTSVSLRSAYNLTSLKSDTSKIQFSFPDLDSNIIRYPSEQFEDKAIIIQIMGSWCPNCADETAFLNKFYKLQNDTNNLEIIALAFEKTRNFGKASQRVNRLKNHFGADYTFLIGGYYDKKEASQQLPMLTDIKSYPTTIFIDKNGVVQKIHTGFSGPATGEEYEKFKQEFYSNVKLITE